MEVTNIRLKVFWLNEAHFHKKHLWKKNIAQSAQFHNLQAYKKENKKKRIWGKKQQQQAAPFTAQILQEATFSRLITIKVPEKENKQSKKSVYLDG